MKNTAPSELFYSSNISIRFNKNSLLLIFVTTFLLTIGNIANAQVTIFNDNFETDFGNWNDGGVDCERNNNTLINGDWNIRLRDNSAIESAMTSDTADLTPYGQINMRFRFRFSGFNNGEELQIRYSTGGGVFTIIQEYTVGSGYSNDVVYTVNIILTENDYVMGATSLFRITSNASANNDIVYIDDINIVGYPAPSNDECINAIELTPNTSCITTDGTTTGSSESQTGCVGTADDDVWYYFVATNTEHTIRVGGSGLYDTVYQVFDGSCAGTSLDCEDSNGGRTPESDTYTGLVIGNTYYVRVYSYFSNLLHRGTFTICITEPCSFSAANGSSTLACPSVDAGSVGATSIDPTIICSAGSTELEASYLELGDTSSYQISNIDYNPPFQFNCLEFPVSVNVDDIWSNEISLPFDFCFYGNTYDSCYIGSNGVIAFEDQDPSSNYSGWVITDDIPSSVNSDAGFFGPSIYGVHHDVDPSVGGEIGYQLITLDSGCQALVAAWSDVPMYADNSKLYSGMIVFYEDTNVIEVYVKEKRIDGTWNNGNAIIGLQASATEGIAAPNRNSLDTNWEVTEEAWRFTPNGASITDLKWYQNSVSMANEIDDPDDDGIITVTPFTTTTYIAEVTYSLCNGATIVETDPVIVTVEGTKTWNGSQSTDWEDPDNWTPVGVPVPTNCVTIPNTSNHPVMIGSIDGEGYNLTVTNNAILTQESNSTLTITNDITVNTGGMYNLEDSSSLIQIDDVANTVDGTFTMDRNTNIRLNDYVYWSSPVTSFNIEDVSPSTSNGYKYQWSPFVNRPAGPPGPLNFGDWDTYDNGTMDIGKGYIIKGPVGHSTTASPLTATFTGNPNNGDIIHPISRSTYTGANYLYQPYFGGDFLLITSDDDNWNLIGNPYPSAISAIDFLTFPANSNIDGVVYLWTHGTDIGTGNSDSFYDDYAYNYNIADYIAYNSSGTSTPSGFNGEIGAGQGFFVLMNDLSSTSETVTFNNSMRSSSYDNSLFYRNPSVINSDDRRIWLDYISTNGETNTTLIAYVNEATNGEDRMFDAINSKGTGLNLYTLINDKNYIIQGRQLPFDDNDIVPIGININQSGIQTIAINTIEGRFNESDCQIFLEDLENGIIHDLKNSPYTFFSEIGIIESRFILRYKNNILGIDDFDSSSGIKVFEDNKELIVKSDYESIQSIEVYDILGRTLFLDKFLSTNRFTINSLQPTDAALFLRIKLIDGNQKITKIIF
jgi:hypothetical protein